MRSPIQSWLRHPSAGRWHCCASTIAVADEAPPDFRFDIRPILSKNCFACHGPDEGHRQADLRLDERDAAVDFGAITPGSPEESELIRRITSEDDEERMPPAETGTKLDRRGNRDDQAVDRRGRRLLAALVVRAAAAAAAADGLAARMVPQRDRLLSCWRGWMRPG